MEKSLKPIWLAVLDSLPIPAYYQPCEHHEARFRKASGRRARPTDRQIDRSIPIDTDRPIDRSTDRPSVLFYIPLWTWSSIGINVAHRLLRQPREHNKARIREAFGRRARSTDRTIVRSTDRPTDRSTNRFDSMPRFGPGPLKALMQPTACYASLVSVEFLAVTSLPNGDNQRNIK